MPNDQDDASEKHGDEQRNDNTDDLDWFGHAYASAKKERCPGFAITRLSIEPRAQSGEPFAHARSYRRVGNRELACDLRGRFALEEPCHDRRSIRFREREYEVSEKTLHANSLEHRVRSLDFTIVCELRFAGQTTLGTPTTHPGDVTSDLREPWPQRAIVIGLLAPSSDPGLLDDVVGIRFAGQCGGEAPQPGGIGKQLLRVHGYILPPAARSLPKLRVLTPILKRSRITLQCPLECARTCQAVSPRVIAGHSRARGHRVTQVRG